MCTRKNGLNEMVLLNTPKNVYADGSNNITIYIQNGLFIWTYA